MLSFTKALANDALKKIRGTTLSLKHLYPNQFVERHIKIIMDVQAVLLGKTLRLEMTLKSRKTDEQNILQRSNYVANWNYNFTYIGFVFFSKLSKCRAVSRTLYVNNHDSARKFSAAIYQKKVKIVEKCADIAFFNLDVHIKAFLMMKTKTHVWGKCFASAARHWDSLVYWWQYLCEVRRAVANSLW